MNTPLDHPDADDNGESDPLEQLLAEALATLEADGQPGLERFLARHEDHATELRAALSDLKCMDLLEQPQRLLPDRFGDFAIKQQLGAGGMGVVFLAEQLSLGREVALKVVRPELLLFEGARERFQREIDAVARLEHPAIVPILATGTADDVPYYAMPRIRGNNGDAVIAALADRAPRELTGADLRRAIVQPESAGDGNETAVDGEDVFAGRWWQAIVRLIRKAALGIHHAHARGILHRDLKPSNLMLTASGQAIVLDFGLAQGNDDARLTRTGSTAGSPAYMAPEQVRGEPADQRTDIYGLAATMHSLLGVRAPYATDNAELLRQRILAGERRALADRVQLPPELLMVLECAMDIDRMRRYPTALAFADDLQAVLDGRPITARRLPFTVRARRFAQRHRAVAAAAAASAVFLVALPTLLLWQQHQANELLQQQVERSDRSVAVSIGAVQRLLAGVSTQKLRNRAAPELAEQMLSDAATLFENLEVDDKHHRSVEDLRLDTLLKLATVQSDLGRLEAADATIGRAMALLGPSPATAAARLALGKLLRMRAGIAMDQYRPEGMAEILAQARRLLTDLQTEPGLGPIASLELSYIAGMDAALDMRSGNAERAEQGMRTAVTMSAPPPETVPGADFVVPHGIARLNLARFLKSLRRYAEALQVIDDLIPSLAEPLREEEENGWPVPRYVVAMALNERARLLQLTKKPAESAAAAQVTIEALDELIRDYPDTPELQRLRGSATANLAILHAQNKRWQTAAKLLESAIADQREALRAKAGDVQAERFLIDHLRMLCWCLRNTGDWTALEAAAREIGGKQLTPPWRATAAKDLLRCAAAAASPAKADELREQAVVWLQSAARDGERIDLDDPIIAAVRDDPRIRELAK